MKSITLTALDIGSGSVKGLCVQKDLKTGTIETLAQAEIRSFGVRNGEVVKADELSKIIQKMKFELEGKTEHRIKDVGVNISGHHLFALSSSGVVSVSRADQKISKEDVQRVLKAASAVNLPSNKQVLDTFPKEFIIDGEGVRDAVGLHGIRLEAKVLLVCVFSPVLENLEKALEDAKLNVSDIILGPLANSRAVLTQEQKELGVVLLNIGFGTTSVSVFEKGEMIDFSVFPIGSSNITNDIAIGLRTEIQTAEDIKKEYGTLKQVKNKDKIKVTDKGLEFAPKFLQNIVESRVTEIFSEVQKRLRKISGGEPLPSGVVLTGGGVKMPHIVDFAKQQFKLPCRIGTVKEIKGIDDEVFSTVAGVILSVLDLEDVGGVKLGHADKSSKIKRIFKSFLP